MPIVAPRHLRHSARILQQGHVADKHHWDTFGGAFVHVSFFSYSGHLVATKQNP